MTPEEVFNIAREAVKALAHRNDKLFKFTYDQIWDNLPLGVNVPSPQRPGPQRRLIREGYIRKTGLMKNAATSARAGSLTPEYAFGAAILGEDQDRTETRLLNVLKDARTGCFSLMCIMSVEEYLNFVES